MDATPEKSGINVGKVERLASVAGGGALVFYGVTKGLAQRWTVGAPLIAAGGALLHRGLTGHCATRAALQARSDNGKASEEIAPLPGVVSSEAAPGHKGILVTKTLTVNAPPDVLYNFWRDFENLPRLMRHLESVSVLDQTRSHWTAKAPLGQTVSWDAEIVRDTPNELIAWRSAPDATVPNSGSVKFSDDPSGRGTQIQVTLEYQPPGGALGALVAKLFGEEPQIQVEDDLRRFKSLIEAGEIPTIEGQPKGGK